MNLDLLNEKQKEAVRHRDGPIKVIAGPGSGKTRVLTHRVAFLIAEYGIKPENILAVTFIRKAAAEMKERINKLLDFTTSAVPVALNGQLTIGTFHALGLKILKTEYPSVNPRMKNFQVLDDGKKKTLLKEVLGPRGLNLDMEVGLVSSRISRWKGELVKPKGLLNYLSDLLPDFIRSKWHKIYQTYETVKSERYLLDYDDLLLCTYDLFKQHPLILQRYQEQFRYVLVDECQDTDLVQWEVMKLLALPECNLMIICDEDQSIYTWRGAKPEYVINFEKSFPGAITIKLEQNYRSTATIVETASRLIKNNQFRGKKELWTSNQTGAEIELLEADNADHEAGLVATEIQSLLQRPGGGDQELVITGEHEPSSITASRSPSLSLRDMAILYRTNAQSRALEDQLISRKIPYIVMDSLGFYDRREIKDILAYLRLVHNPEDDEALIRVINVPSRYLGKVFLKELQDLAFQRKTSLFDQLGVWGDFSKPYMGKNSKDFKQLILSLQSERLAKKLSISGLINEIRARTDYDHYIAEDEEPSPDDSRIQNLQELCESASRFSRLDNFLFYVAEVQRQKKQAEGNHNAVTLLTIHKAKGLEFKVIFLAGCVQGLLPHHKALQADSPEGTNSEASAAQLEEERRLCYVAITRAKERLYLSYPRVYQGKTLEPSQFLTEMGFTDDEEIGDVSAV